MSLLTICESDMTFSHPVADFFSLENSQSHKQLNDASQPQGLKIAEAALLKDGKVLLIEAKTSQPQNLKKFVADICAKLEHALLLFVNLHLQRHAEPLPAGLSQLELKQMEFRFVLVVKTSKKAWLAPLRDALDKALRRLQLLFAIKAPAVFVFNEDMARSHKLIV